VTDPSGSRIGEDLGLGFLVPAGTSADDQGRRRVHPITPLVHGATAVPVAALLAFAWGGGLLATFGLGAFASGMVVVIVIGSVVTAWSYLAWRNMYYWFDADGDVRVDSGVITHRQRRLQLSRLQAVDVAQPLFARLFSMAEVTIEVAGTGDSRVRLRYLRLADARALRSEVLARAAGLQPEAGEAPEVVIASVPPRDLAVSLAMRTVTAGLLLLTAALVVGTVLTQGWGGLAIAVVTGGVPILIVVAEFIRYFRFTVSDSPDGLRLRFGLARTETRTVPPGRVQAIEFVEPWLWRRWGWVRLRVTIAGIGGDDASSRGRETLLMPVATRDTALLVVHRLMPGLDLDALDWHAAPARALWRSPIQGARLAVAWDRLVLAARCGRVTRRLSFVPHPRTQSVRVTQGPWERSLGLATVHVDVTPGPVRVRGMHLDALFARQVADAQADRARRARGADTSIRWAASE
jgi:putative membrane protein